MHSPLSSLFFLMTSENSLELLTWWMVLPVRGFRILADSFATPCVTEPLLDTKGLRGLFLYILGSPHSLGELASVGYIFQSVVSSIPDSVLILLMMFINFPFCLLVGSMFRGLYVLVSSSSSFIFLMLSLLSITTSATPFSAVEMMWSPSDFNSFMTLHSTLVKLALGVFNCLRILEISALNSSASVGLRFWQAISIAVMYSL